MGRKMQATDSFVIGTEDGGEIIVQRGDIADAEHEVVRRAPQCWAPLKARFEVEEATAAPGRRRAAKVEVEVAAETEITPES